MRHRRTAIDIDKDIDGLVNPYRMSNLRSRWLSYPRVAGEGFMGLQQAAQELSQNYVSCSAGGGEFLAIQAQGRIIRAAMKRLSMNIFVDIACAHPPVHVQGLR